MSYNSFVYRYKLAMRGIDISSIGEDDPPVAEFVFFGDTEEQLVGVPALSLTAAAPNIHNKALWSTL